MNDSQSVRKPEKVYKNGRVCFIYTPIFEPDEDKMLSALRFVLESTPKRDCIKQIEEVKQIK